MSLHTPTPALGSPTFCDRQRITPQISLWRRTSQTAHLHLASSGVTRGKRHIAMRMTRKITKEKQVSRAMLVDCRRRRQSVQDVRWSVRHHLLMRFGVCPWLADDAGQFGLALFSESVSFEFCTLAFVHPASHRNAKETCQSCNFSQQL